MKHIVNFFTKCVKSSSSLWFFSQFCSKWQKLSPARAKLNTINIFYTSGKNCHRARLSRGKPLLNGWYYWKDILQLSRWLEGSDPILPVKSTIWRMSLCTVIIETKLKRNRPRSYRSSGRLWLHSLKSSNPFVSLTFPQIHTNHLQTVMWLDFPCTCYAHYRLVL